MHDTEPMPAVTPPRKDLSSGIARRFSQRGATFAIAALVVALSFALFFVSWAHHELVAMRADVRDARIAAAVATRAADRAELAARSAQSALASVSAPSDPDRADTTPSPDSASDSP